MKILFAGFLFVIFLAGCGRQDSGKEAPSPVAGADEAKCVEALEAAVEREDFPSALSCAAKLAGSTNVAVRLRCVESIGWFGGKSAEALIPYLDDPNEDVRSAAEDQWDSAVNEIDDAPRKAALVEAAMVRVRDREIMDSISFQLNDLPSSLSIGIIVRLMAGGNAVAQAAAKEAYEFVTGDEWKNETAARKWLEENRDEDDE